MKRVVDAGNSSCTVPVLRYNEIMSQLTRITFNPKVMGGKPCIRGIRVTVGTIVGLLASGQSFAEILKAYPYLEEDDLREALAYTSDYTQDRHKWLPDGSVREVLAELEKNLSTQTKS